MIIPNDDTDEGNEFYEDVDDGTIDDIAGTIELFFNSDNDIDDFNIVDDVSTDDEATNGGNKKLSKFSDLSSRSMPEGRTTAKGPSPVNFATKLSAMR